MLTVFFLTSGQHAFERQYACNRVYTHVHPGMHAHTTGFFLSCALAEPSHFPLVAIAFYSL